MQELQESISSNQEEMVSGSVTQIVFYNAENGYSVLRMNAPDGEEITATGCLPNVGVGEELTLSGKWVSHPSYGDQFAADSFERNLPTSTKGIADYLGSGLIKGIGPRLAARIAKTFGEDTFRILTDDPERLTDIRGITPKKARDIGRQFQEQSELRQLMDFLSEHELPLELTARLYKRLGTAAVDALTANPFLLCDDYFKVDFRVVDTLAAGLGISMLAPERADAGILYTMTANLDNGHSFITTQKVVDTTIRLLSGQNSPITTQHLMQSILRLTEQGQLVRELLNRKDVVYLRAMHEAELYLTENLSRMAENNYQYDFDVEELMTALETDNDLKYAPLQREAIAAAAKNGLVILTGGPGTGKSTTVHGMVRILEALGLNVVLAAPTGRAAKRLSELCGMEAKTIHRLLEAGYQGGFGRLGFQRCRTNPLECDAVILDEVSMVDIQLMQALVEALPHGARLVLVGDADQLPPVGPGNFLRDVIASRRVPTIQLKEIFRQAQESDIVMNAHAINMGQMPVASGKDGDFFIMRKSSAADIIDTVASLCAVRLPRHYGFTPSQIQVLSPSRRQGAGTMQLNRTLQEVLNPPSDRKAEKRFGDTIFRTGDRVMQVRNNYDIVWDRMDGSDSGCGMFNGDVGEIIQIFPEQECLSVRFDDKLATYTYDMLGELELAYAMTVHKAQGSEFDAVVVALAPGTNARLLTRNILYTAITRAKKLLVIVGSPDVLHDMIDNGKRGRRYSALKLRLRGVTTEPITSETIVELPEPDRTHEETDPAEK